MVLGTGIIFHIKWKLNQHKYKKHMRNLPKGIMLMSEVSKSEYEPKSAAIDEYRRRS